jgi:hypothetical protein
MTLTKGSGAVRKPVVALAFLKVGVAESKNLPLLQRAGTATIAGGRERDRSLRQPTALGEIR